VQFAPPDGPGLDWLPQLGSKLNQQRRSEGSFELQQNLWPDVRTKARIGAGTTIATKEAGTPRRRSGESRPPVRHSPCPVWLETFPSFCVYGDLIWVYLHSQILLFPPTGLRSRVVTMRLRKFSVDLCQSAHRIRASPPAETKPVLLDVQIQRRDEAFLACFC